MKFHNCNKITSNFNLIFLLSWIEQAQGSHKAMDTEMLKKKMWL